MKKQFGSESKNFKSFTVGQLIELGFDVRISNHDAKTEDKARKLLKVFKDSEAKKEKLNDTCNLIEIKENQFTATMFVSRFN